MIPLTVVTKGEKVNYTQYVRKPFLVQAVEVTKENIAELAPKIGTLGEKSDGTPFIKVNKLQVPNVYRVFPGFWVTVLDDTVRCYSRKAFFAQFVEASEEVTNWVDSLNGEPVPAKG